MKLQPQSLASFIDHTLLKPGAKVEEFEKLCQEALENRFKTVCVEIPWLPYVVEKLKGSSVLPIAVICFPEGTSSTREKVEQTKIAIQAGAKEIDMVLNRVWLKAGKFKEVFEDIKSVVEAAEGLPVKVILETSELSHEEKVSSCVLAKLAGASFVKTSTGFSKSGATVEDIQLMRRIVGPEMGVKASGGIRSQADAIKMLEAGANRLGTSASVAIVKGEESTIKNY